MMDDETKIPKMMELLFGEVHEPFGLGINSGASERLKRWCQAFEEWLADRKQNYRPGAYKQALLTWRRLLGEGGKMPWELEQGDIEQHRTWMEAKGYAPTTIYNAVGILESFYRYCGQRQVDPECGAGFNPAEGARRPKIQRYAGAKLLSPGEVERLLGMMRRDETPLGKRDYAFTLARLRLGVPLSNLQRLRWGQIEQEGGEVWVRWRPEAGQVHLPEEAWEAIQEWLAASGRLEGMREGTFVFTPLRYPGKALDKNIQSKLRENGREAKDWDEGRYLSTSQLLGNLKLYGRRAGIPEDKLTLMALRRTAMRLRMEAGGGEVQVFLDSQEEAKSARYRLKWLPPLPEETGGGSEEEGKEAALPVRKARPFQPGEGMTHGLYAHSQPAAEVMAVLEENIQGVEEEIAGLRRLERGLLEKQGKARNGKEAAQLADAYTLTTARLRTMIEGEKHLNKSGEEAPWVEEFLTMLDRAADARGEAPVSEEARAEARGEIPELAIATRRLVEEMAGTRCMLRRTLALAMEAEKKDDPGEFMHLVEIYGNGCNRMIRLMRAEGADQTGMEAYIKEQIETAIREVSEELGLGRREESGGGEESGE